MSRRLTTSVLLLFSKLIKCIEIIKSLKVKTIEEVDFDNSHEFWVQELSKFTNAEIFVGSSFEDCQKLHMVIYLYDDSNITLQNLEIYINILDHPQNFPPFGLNLNSSPQKKKKQTKTSI
jgi:hypothetical protein